MTGDVYERLPSDMICSLISSESNDIASYPVADLRLQAAFDDVSGPGVPDYLDPALWAAIEHALSR